MDVSLIICTHNRSGLLSRALASVVAQQVPSSIDWEVIVVDNACTDNTADVVGGYTSKSPNVRHVTEAIAGLSYARNRGIKEAVGELLCFVDDDVILPCDYIGNAVCAWRKGLWDVGGGRVIGDYQAQPPAWIQKLPASLLSGPFGQYDRGEEDFTLAKHDTKFPIGANMLIPRGAIEAVGMFDTTLGRKGNSLRSGEDTQFYYSCLNAGLRIGYCAKCCLKHFVPRKRMTRCYFVRWYYMWGVGAEEESLPENTVFWFRVPRFEWRRLIESSLGLLVSPLRRTFHQSLFQCAKVAGTVFGYLSKTKAFVLSEATSLPDTGRE
jgi:glucosyl-dolichyl phosphate glucuronosyltransferase